MEMNIIKSEKINKNELAYLALRLFGMLYVLLLFSIQLFWVVYKGELVSIELTWDLIALVAAFLVAYIVAVFGRVELYRVTMRMFEWLLHLILAGGYLIFLFLLQARDEFQPIIPFTWLFYFWVVLIGLDLATAVISNLDKGSLNKWFSNATKLKTFLIALIPIWLGIIYFITISRYPVHIWIVAVVYHAVMIPVSITRTHNQADLLLRNDEMSAERHIYDSFKSLFTGNKEKSLSSKKSKPLITNVKHVRVILLAFFIFMAWNQWGFFHQALGSLEDNYYLIIGMFMSPLFYVGMALAVISIKFERPNIGDLSCFILIGLSIINVNLLAPIVFGYASWSLIFVNSGQNATSRTSSTIAFILSMTIGLYLFTFNGMLTDTADAIQYVLKSQVGMSIDKEMLDEGFVNLFLFSILSIVSLFYGLLLLAQHLIGLKRSKSRKELVDKLKHASSEQKGVIKGIEMTKEKVRKPALILLLVLFIGLISPFFLLNLTVKAPPITEPKKERVQLEDFCGTALAGYSGLENEYEILNELGIHWLRIHFSWKSIESENNAWEYEKYDTFVQNTNANDIKVIAMLNYPPAWVDKDTKNYVPREMVPEYLQFVEKTIRRYKNDVDAWEIWNEPNLERFWDGPMADFHYLFNRTAELIHSIDPDLYLVGGSASSAGAGYVPSHLEDMFKAGIMSRVDAISMHYYSNDPDTMYGAILRIKAVGKKYGFQGDYIFSEQGNPTGGEYPWMVTMEQHAINVIKTHVIASTFGIKTMIWYCTKDSGWNTTVTDIRNSERFFGLLYKDYSGWKKAGYAYRLFSRFCSTSKYTPDLIQTMGFMSATDLMTALYQRPDGTWILILWYDPTLHEQGTLKVHLEIEEQEGSLYQHDIHSRVNQSINDKYLEIDDTPIFLTFKPKNESRPILIQVEESALTIGLFFLMGSSFILGMCALFLIHNNNIQRM